MNDGRKASGDTSIRNIETDTSSRISLSSEAGTTNQVNPKGTGALAKRKNSRVMPSLESISWDDNVKILPSDESFSWSKEDYNSFQRSVDVWSFVLSLRARIYLDNAKWTFVGGFTEEKQVLTVSLSLSLVKSVKQM